ncbi:MAG: DUF4835 domain-containing protein [Flavobacteriales bacterium]|nr:DUF4835 domain-containing protein [Flavobacteriales bacterium]|tara:strand:- start:6220 stop:7116 length:897 start_codon:yes stop_codon:yes gene_type:complete
MRLIIFLILSSHYILISQELNCKVSVNYSSISSPNKEMFNSMRQSIYEFMNNTNWTNDIFDNEERIECTILIRLDQQISTDEFSGSISVQSSRPIYKTLYNSPILNIFDDQFRFKYIEFETLEFNENTHISNLTSVLAFYAYLIIGMDYDTFSNKGGENFFLKAQKIVSNAQNDNNATGWKSFEGLSNRYWLVENLLNPDFANVRNFYYKYHLEGLDQFTEKPEFVREYIAESILSLRTSYNQRPRGYLFQIFFDTKTDEIVNIFSKGTIMQADELVNLLNQMSVKNSQKWSKILTSQ